MSSMLLTEATITDTESLIAWMRELWATDTQPFNEALSREGLAMLLGERSWGRVWIVPQMGYLILTFGFSLEFGGRDAFVDELFIQSSHRGQGIGAAAIEEACKEAAKLGIKAIHLEVADTNTRAEAFYRRSGFRLHTRRLMTRWLEDLPG